MIHYLLSLMCKANLMLQTGNLSWITKNQTEAILTVNTFKKNAKHIFAKYQFFMETNPD